MSEKPEAEKVMDVLWNYLGIDTADGLRDWITRLHQVGREGGELEFPNRTVWVAPPRDP